jgi:hypothetical protein
MQNVLHEDEISTVPLALEWRRWLLLEEGGTGWLKAGLILVLVAGLWLILLASLPILVATVLSLAFVAVLFPYFLPVTYQVDAIGVTMRYSWGNLKSHKWSTIENHQLLPKGYQFTTKANPRPSSFFLPLPPEPTAQNILQGLITQNLS